MPTSVSSKRSVGRWRRLSAALAMGLSAALGAGTLAALPAAAAPPALASVSTCADYSYFMVTAGQLACSNDRQTWVTTGAGSGLGLNGLAYNDINKTLYAIREQTNRLYSISLDGTVTQLGTVSGLVASSSPNVKVVAGDIDPATGTYYVGTNTDAFYSINIGTRVATNLTANLPIPMGNDFVTIAGDLWTIEDGSGGAPQYLAGFSLSDYSTKTVNVTIAETGPAGAQWTDIGGSGDSIVWFSNADGKIYRAVNLKNGGNAPTLLASNLGFNTPIDGATGWSLLPNGSTVDRGNGQLTMSWTPSTSVDPSAIVTYLVQAYDPQGNLAGTCSYTTASDSGNACTVTGLTNGTPYTYTITVTNQGGQQETSDPYGPGTPATTPSAPRNVSVQGGAQSATVTWDTPSSDGGAAIDSYLVLAYGPDGNVAGTCSYTVGQSPTNSCTITGLTNGTAYTFKAKAHNDVGTGPPASPVDNASVTPADVPSAPKDVTVQGGSEHAVVSWNTPDSDGGAAIDSYTATAYDSDGNAVASCTYTVGDSPTNTCDLTGLANGSSYTIKVTAHNRVGDGPPGSPAGNAPVTPATTPSEPLNVGLTGGNGGISVNWDPPSSNGGAAIDSYTATAYDPDGNPIASCTYVVGDLPENTCTISGLTNGTAYTVSVTAHNRVGDGPAGSSSGNGAVTPANVPSEPTSVSAQIGIGSATVSWSIPSSDGGAAIDGYTATAYDADGNAVGTCTYTGNNPTGSMSCDISGLANGGTFTFKVTAHNRVGDGPASGAVGPFTTPDVPSAPNNASASIGAGSATVSFTMPSSDGGSAITYYVAKAYDPDGNLAGSCVYIGNDPTGTMDCTINGLAANTTYTFDVVAYNAVGVGPPSGSLGPLTTPNVPSEPNDVSVSVDPGSATVSFTMPSSDGGSAITYYVAKAYDANGNLAGSCVYYGNDPTGTMDCTINGLAANTAYTFDVVAYNAVGVGPPSGIFGPVTTPNVPSEPLNVAAAGGSTQGSVDVSFTMPSSDGGSAITYYVAKAYDANGNLAGSCVYYGNDPTGTMSCTIDGLGLGVVYTFKVQAFNGVGGGPNSSTEVRFRTPPWACVPGQQLAVVNGQMWSTSAANYNSWTAVGSAGDVINALAYNVSDGWAYGLLQKGSNRSTLYRVSGDGTQTNLGRVAGLPRATYLAGSVDQGGDNYYVSSQNRRLYRINLNTLVATAVSVPNAFPKFGPDLVVNGRKVWTVTGTLVASMDLFSGEVTTAKFPKAFRNAHIGGLSFDPSGDLLALSNQGGRLFKITSLTSPRVSVTQIGDLSSGVPAGLDVDLTACTRP